MESRSILAAASRLLLEAAIVLSPAEAFLWAYSSQYHAPDGAVIQHGKFVAMSFLLYMSIRLNLHAWGGRRRPARYLSTALAVCVLLVGIAFYALQLAGLKFWGNLPTWSLVRAYLPLLAASVEQAQLDSAVIAGGMVLSMAALVAMIHLLLRRVGYASGEFNLRQRLVTIMLLCLAAFGVQRQVDSALWSEANWSRREPLHNFFRDIRARFVQGHMVRPLQLQELQRREDDERHHLSPISQRRSVVVIVVDALRAENLKRYGYKRDTMPYVDQLASSVDSATIERAYSACNESTCGIIAIAASRFVHSIVPRMITMSEVLRASGYRTYYLVSGDHTNFYGLREFYGANDGYVDGTTQRGRHLNDDRNILDGLDRLDLRPEQPFLLHIHLKSTHALGIRWSKDAPYQPSENYTRLVMTGAPGGLDPTPFINYYDNGIRQTDGVIRYIVERLRQRGLLKGALLVITGDHGESLGERGQWSHANSVEEHALRVPLLLMSFGRPLSPSVHQRRTAFQVDIAPTILAEMGAEAPTTWQGVPLQSQPTDHRLALFSQGEAYGLYETVSDGGLFKYWHVGGQRFAVRIERGSRASIEPLAEEEIRERAVHWDTALVPLTAAILPSPPLCLSSTRSIAVREACASR